MPVEIWTYNFGSSKLLRNFASSATSSKASKPTGTATDPSGHHIATSLTRVNAELPRPLNARTR